MKTRKLALLLCLTMLFSILSPTAAFAAHIDPDFPPDDPIEPDPYSYISQINIDFIMYSNGNTSDYCSAYVPGGYSYTLTMRLQQRVNGAWQTSNPIMTWSKSGSDTVYLDKTYNGLSYGTYRLTATVTVYNSQGLICESVTEHSRTAVYNADGVVYYW